MSLDLFQTFLLPVTENGKIQFHQKPTAAHPAGRILKADFSRPDLTPGQSGATVWRDGKLVVLNEDDPDWSEDIGGGCAKLVMRPQVENLINNALTYSNWQILGFEVVASNIIAPNGLGQAFHFRENDTSDNPLVRYVNTQGLTGNKNASFFLKSISQSVNVPISVGGSSFGENVLINSEWGRYSVSANVSRSDCLIGGFNQIQRGSGLEFFAWGSQLTDGLELRDFIPSNGTILTRSANLFTLNNLVTEGVLGSDGKFSLAISIENHIDGGMSGDQSFLFTDSGHNIFWLNGLREGFTPRDGTGGGYLNAGKQATKFVLTFDGQNLKYYYNGEKHIDANLSTGGHIIDSIIVKAVDNDFHLMKQAITPVVLTEAEALATLAKL